LIHKELNTKNPLSGLPNTFGLTDFSAPRRAISEVGIAEIRRKYRATAAQQAARANEPATAKKLRKK
jgi:hypothetical protein